MVNKMELRNIMTKNIYTLKKTNTIIDAIIKMRNKDIGFIPIIDDNNQVLGVITDRDIILLLASNHKLNEQLNNVMQKNIYSLEETDTLVNACEKMSFHRIKRLIITRNNKLVGIISTSDLIRNDKSNSYSVDLLKEITFNEKYTYEFPQLDLKIDDFPL